MLVSYITTWPTVNALSACICCCCWWVRCCDCDSGEGEAAAAFAASCNCLQRMQRKTHTLCLLQSHHAILHFVRYTRNSESSSGSSSSFSCCSSYIRSRNVCLALTLAPKNFGRKLLCLLLCWLCSGEGDGANGVSVGGRGVASHTCACISDCRNSPCIHLKQQKQTHCILSVLGLSLL